MVGHLACIQHDCGVQDAPLTEFSMATLYNVFWELFNHLVLLD